MNRALVLNVTDEPLSVVSGRRAALLVYAERADVVHPGDEQLRSERMVLAVPSVVRLRRFVRVPHQRHLSLSRRGVLVRDGFSCQYCGARAETIDHVVPRSRGGGHTWDNLVAACRPCNVRKGARLIREAGMRLGREPRAPGRSLWVASRVGTVPTLWEPYLRVA
ncbi:MAG: HNH endonuclease [Acidimicrobiales bacterium]|nr:HNH endonuclease [Acidimicrobiales bacterium]